MEDLDYPKKLLVVHPKIPKRKLKFFGGDEVEALPGFAVPADRPKQVENARKWAKSYRSYLAVSTGLVEKEVDNNPFGIRIYGYEYRTNRIVFKVYADDGLMYDLRDEEALDVILHEGISKNGVVNSKFVWARNRAHMRMVREKKLDEALVKDILL